MEIDVLIIAVGAMAGLGITLAVVLAVANKKLHVYEDPRIDQVEEILPGTNCGACGQPGCRAFAEAVTDGRAEPGKCTVSPAEEIETIAEVLGVDVGGDEKQVARLACAGGFNVARQRARYVGMSTCQAADLVGGGGKGCAWGCLLFGDCMEVCDYSAIRMDSSSLPVVDEDLCTACGDCVEICPKDLFSLQPISHELWVACKNEAFGDEAEDECEVACNTCGRCAADSPEGVVSMINNLAVIDYTKNSQTSPAAIERCPTGAIVWRNLRQGISKGKQAKRIVRRTPLPLG